MGPFFLDGGLPKAKVMLRRMFKEIIPKEHTDERCINYKGRLQELVQKKLGLMPRYKTIAEEGPQHKKQFIVQVTVSDYNAVGHGANKKDAQQVAARKVFNQMKKEVLDEL